MKHAEVVFETGAKSVVSYDNEEELKSFIEDHVRRAKAGLPGSAQDIQERDDIEPDLSRQAAVAKQRPAERISKVLLYDKHPLEYAKGGFLYATSVQTLVDGLTDAKNKTINVWELIAALRREINATHTQNVGPHESHYKMRETGELDMSFLNDGPVSE